MAQLQAQTTARLKTRYEEEIRPALIERFGYSSAMQAPKIQKITLNMGIDAKQDSKILEAATKQLATIAGQQPNIRRARKSIAAFKLREGMPVGISVTLRRERSYEFLDRLCSIAIPRIRDFRGLNAKSFDGRGNYSMGVREQIIFPEIDYDEVDQVRGMDITITTTASTDEEAFALLTRSGCRSPRRAASRVARPARRSAGRPTQNLRRPAMLTPEQRTRQAPRRLRPTQQRRRRRTSGQDLAAGAPGAPRQIQDAGLQPLPSVRPAAGRLQEVRPLPDLPARNGAHRADSGDDEVVVVGADQCQ